jgi:hypothetical protein
MHHVLVEAASPRIGRVGTDGEIIVSEHAPSANHLDALGRVSLDQEIDLIAALMMTLMQCISASRRCVIAGRFSSAANGATIGPVHAKHRAVSVLAPFRMRVKRLSIYPDLPASLRAAWIQGGRFTSIDEKEFAPVSRQFDFRHAKRSLVERCPMRFAPNQLQNV